MLELLAVEKRRLLVTNGYVTEADFEVCWEMCWQVMVTERAWPHATAHRRSWRAAMLAAKPEYGACWVGVETGFSRYIGALAEAMDQSRFAGDGQTVGQLVA